MAEHLVIVDKDKRLVNVYRIVNSERILYTAYELDAIAASGFLKFASQLGGDIIVDDRDLDELIK